MTRALITPTQGHRPKTRRPNTPAVLALLCPQTPYTLKTTGDPTELSLMRFYLSMFTVSEIKTVNFLDTRIPSTCSEVKQQIITGPSNSTHRCVPQRTESRDSNRYLHTNVHSSSLHNSQEAETTRMAVTGEWTNKMRHIYAKEYYSAVKGNRCALRPGQPSPGVLHSCKSACEQP